MRTPALAALGFAAYLVFLVAKIPASFALAHGHHAGMMEVLEASGTVWRGGARVVLNTPAGPIAVDRLEWSWRPTRLAAGRFAFDIGATSAGMEARAEGARTFSQWEARDLTVRGDAAAMTVLVPWIAPFGPQGQVAITSPQLASDGQELHGQARIEWKAAAVALSEVKPLGSYRADIEAEGRVGKVTITTLEGALRIAGTGTLTPPARFAFDGEARAEGPQAKALEPLLLQMGPRRADGAQVLAWRLN
jgi:general secretion pathway protein N